MNIGSEKKIMLNNEQQSNNHMIEVVDKKKQVNFIDKKEKDERKEKEKEKPMTSQKSSGKIVSFSVKDSKKESNNGKISTSNVDIKDKISKRLSNRDVNNIKDTLNSKK